MHHLHYYMEMQKKKEEQRNTQDIYYVNSHLRQHIQSLKKHINKDDYKADVMELMHYTQGVNIWNVEYRNNLENPRVALAQGVLAWRIIERAEVPNKEHERNKVKRLMMLLGHVDWHYTMEFNALTRA